MELVYCDDRIVVCVKPAGVVSTDEPGGLPDLVRSALGDPNANIRTVHRLDQAVSGLMVLARTARAASDLSAQIREGAFRKEYLAVVHGKTPESGSLEDHLLRDKKRKMTYVATEASVDAQKAILHYKAEGQSDQFSKLRIQLITGRTHQIRVQFSSRGYPLVGDRKYGVEDAAESIALWSCLLQFQHPRTREILTFTKQPPTDFPWTEFLR